ncbi:MAG: YraN family protein [Gammaproteobacteria bacterium]|nr:YraN family protein [Gammaproteobacteria bacterium]MBU1489155.1 YraN family protein [Gammaproteobacteria bacterium]MBU2066502.1 YraN family protein [Gammaproteobacteria bacterium]MBU2139418.1 YraN family protein [Gammaproteobacteria bacterium]MBU2217974.1 YraN family protein [Gammaproteobacteria bacterium]
MTERPSTQASGSAAEARALAYLQAQGLRLIAQNWRCRHGELDLVMLHTDTVVFVEVRYRRHAAWGGAMESVDARKREKLTLAAAQFLQQTPRWARQPCRFDVIALNGATDNDLNWIQNAFDT